MIEFIDGLGQLGTELKIQVKDYNFQNRDDLIYHTWNFLDRNEDIQKREFEKFKIFLENKKERKVFFISTYSEAENNYVKYKKLAEDYLLNFDDSGRVIRLPNLIGKGICQRFKDDEVKAYGEIELLTIEDAAKKVLEEVQKNTMERVIRIYGSILPAHIVRELILFGKR